MGTSSRESGATRDADSFAATMLGSTVSGMLSRIPCHPLDTIKSRLQVGEFKSGIFETGRAIVRAEGVGALYRGFGLTFWASAPATCVYFSSYEFAKRKFGSSVWAHLGAGLVAEALSCSLYVPIDVIKERMQVQGGATRSRSGQGPYYATARDAVSQIVRSGEGVAGLYRGYGATLAAFGPFSALYFACYEELRSYALRLQPAKAREAGSLPLALQVLVAASSGAIASAATAPLDLVKLIMQTEVWSADTATRARPLSFLRLLRSVWEEKGVRGLFKGAGARVAFHSASTAVALSCFEECRALARGIV
jgi:hypothetical protein